MACLSALSVFFEFVHTAAAAPQSISGKGVASTRYGYRGQYKTITGIVWNVDTAVSHTVLLNDQRIRFVDIVSIESDHEIYDPGMGETRGIFETSWEVYAT